MNNIPFNLGTLHFVGIGGSGMSCIAELMHNLGYKVQGSDISASQNVLRLKNMGIRVETGHCAENINGASVVVVSSAIRENNPEIIEARYRRIPVVRRSEMLAELMRLKWSIAVGGTHGKTTTTSMIGAVMQAAGLDPTVANGGIINSYGTNAHLGDGKWLVAEADESDGSFIKLPATAVVVTNMDPEHLDYYGSYEKMKEAFLSFVQNIPFYGFACLCSDHPEIQKLISKVSDRLIITYGFNQQAQICAQNINMEPGLITFDVQIAAEISSTKRNYYIKNIKLPVYGKHNIQNAMAAIGVGLQLGVNEEQIKAALSNFKGVQRRFTKRGSVNNIDIIDDYAHHPVEIMATIKAARDVVKNNVIVIFQPHRYSRVENLFEMFCTAFNDADYVIVADIYSAGENEIEGINKHVIAEGLRTHGHRHVIELDAPENLPQTILKIANQGDIILCLGAGTISSWAKKLPEQLNKLYNGEQQ
ncbi:MAG: UDP-N-acetylmuramate--L-alanine ligase [Alphaproteobacteria bacterium]|nr:UDP-N-acetylmuramate--L-alanine ligase [Alphaproteobacteria bacterium]